MAGHHHDNDVAACGRWRVDLGRRHCVGRRVERLKVRHLFGSSGTSRLSQSSSVVGFVTCRVEFSSRCAQSYVCWRKISSFSCRFSSRGAKFVGRSMCVRRFSCSKNARQTTKTCASAFFVLSNCTKKQTNVRHTVASCRVEKTLAVKNLPIVVCNSRFHCVFVTCCRFL